MSGITQLFTNIFNLGPPASLAKSNFQLPLQFGSSDLQQPGTALSNATYWKLLLLSNLTMSYVFQKTTHPSLQFSMALQLIEKDMARSMLIHESGWCSKTHLGVQRVSQSNSSLTYLLTTF